MKHKNLHVKIIIPIMVVILAAITYFGVILINTFQEKELKSIEVSDILQIPPAEAVVSFTELNSTYEKETVNAADKTNKDVKASYVYKNIVFVSYTDTWDEPLLEKLCDELLENKHGSEIDYLSMVRVYGQDDEEILGTQHSEVEVLDIPMSLTQMIPKGYSYDMPNNISIISLYGGDRLTTPEQMAFTLSHEYGHHFTLYYFTLEGTPEEIESDPYFLARYDSNKEIRYTTNDRANFQDYLNNHMWYLIEIAAEDYVYLMGSPNTKRQMEYYDTRDLLYMNIRGQEDEITEFYEKNNESTFNQSPHENIALPLPDQVDGLSDLFYSMIDAESPSYNDNSDKANEIVIDISRRNKQGKTYYKVFWNKPWQSEDVTYTLVAYNEDDELRGAIKSIKGDETASAYIGAVVVETENYYHYYNSDSWTEKEFLRLRVVVTFDDGTAVISPPLDRSFS